MRVCNAANPTQIKNRFLFRAVSVTVGDISSISAFTFSFAIATDFLYCRSGAMLHSGDLVKIELILVVEQETPPLYLWKAPNRLIERFIPFFLNHAFIKALRHTQRPSVKGFVPYLVKLPVPLVPLEKIPVPALHCSDTSNSWDLPCPSLKLIKYLVPLSVDSSRSVYALTLYAIPLASCKK